jgi:hypothetical protein
METILPPLVNHSTPGLEKVDPCLLYLANCHIQHVTGRQVALKRVVVDPKFAQGMFPCVDDDTFFIIPSLQRVRVCLHPTSSISSSMPTMPAPTLFMWDFPYGQDKASWDANQATRQQFETALRVAKAVKSDADAKQQGNAVAGCTAAFTVSEAMFSEWNQVSSLQQTKIDFPHRATFFWRRDNMMRGNDSRILHDTEPLVSCVKYLLVH